LLDSVKIWFVLLRFGLVSLLTAVLDNTVFFLAFQAGAGVLLAERGVQAAAATGGGPGVAASSTARAAGAAAARWRGGATAA